MFVGTFEVQQVADDLKRITDKDRLVLNYSFGNNLCGDFKRLKKVNAIQIKSTPIPFVLRLRNLVVYNCCVDTCQIYPEVKDVVKFNRVILLYSLNHGIGILFKTNKLVLRL